jgi:1,2-phenylacetyl-CoA epoxidase catalytic subunit
MYNIQKEAEYKDSYHMAFLNTHAMAAAQGSKESLKMIKDGLNKEFRKKSSSNPFANMSDEELTTQAEKFGITLEAFKDALSRGWAPKVIFT